MRALEDLVSLLTRLPGIGRKSALRMTYYLLKADQRYADALAERIRTLRGRSGFARYADPIQRRIPAPYAKGPKGTGALSAW